MLPIILASTSPRRKEIMNLLHIPYTVVAPDYEEDMTLPLSPSDLAKYLAEWKARSLIDMYPQHCIIWADSFCVLWSTLLGKPKDRTDAKNMLQRISGNTIEIITWISIIETPTGETWTEASTSTLTFDVISEEQLERYLGTNERQWRAGAFAFQWTAWVFINHVQWDYNSIIWLPLHLLYGFLSKKWYV